MNPSVSKVGLQGARSAPKEPPRHAKTVQMKRRCTTNPPNDLQGDPRGVHGEPGASKVSWRAPKVMPKMA